MLPDPALYLNTCGFDSRHAPDLVIDRPRGLDIWLFVYCLTPIRLRDQDGDNDHPAGVAVLYPPHQAQRYHGIGPPGAPGFTDHWCMFTGPDVRKLTRSLHLPIYRAVPCQANAVVPPLRALCDEKLRAAPHWREACAGLLRLLLVGFSRSASDPAAPVPNAVAERIRDLRARLHGDLGRRWTIAAMAALAKLSPSRFSAVYRLVHHVSPLEDLIAARIEHARMLLNSGERVAETAAQVGFGDIHHFSRLFRARIGCSPRAFARAGGKE